jgi:hypothetical protein
VSNNYVITDSKEAMMSQVQNMYQKNMDIVDNVDSYRKTADQCKELLGKLNP